MISHAGTGWRTQGTGFGYSAGVTGRQFCNDFNVSWNVFWAVTGHKGGKSSNCPHLPLPQSRAETEPAPVANRGASPGPVVSKRLKRAPRQGTHPMMRMLARILGIGIETADLLVRSAHPQTAGSTGSGALRRPDRFARSSSYPSDSGRLARATIAPGLKR